MLLKLACRCSTLQNKESTIQVQAVKIAHFATVEAYRGLLGLLETIRTYWVSFGPPSK